MKNRCQKDPRTDLTKQAAIQLWKRWCPSTEQFSCADTCWQLVPVFFIILVPLTFCAETEKKKNILQKSQGWEKTCPQYLCIPMIQKWHFLFKQNLGCIFSVERGGGGKRQWCMHPYIRKKSRANSACSKEVQSIIPQAPLCHSLDLPHY